MMYSVIFPQLLGYSGVGHDPLVAITFPVGIYLEDIIIAHMSCCDGAFLVATLRASQPI